MILKLIRKLKNNDLIRGSFVLFTGSMSGNILAYVYNVVIGRMIGPTDYGTFSSLVAIMYIIGVFSSTLSLLVAKFSAEAQSHQADDVVYSVFKYTTKKFLLIGLLTFLLSVAIAPLIDSFLKIGSVVPVIILNASLLVLFLLAINRGVLQGMLKFFSFSFNVNLEILLKIIISALFIYLGLKINGAVLGLTLGVLIAYFLSFISLGKIFKNSREVPIDTHLLKKYAFPLFISFLGMTLLYTIDVILAKHYLNSYDAGIYSALSLFGKIIFFASGTIGFAMFPMAAEKNANGQKHFYLLRDAIIIVLLISMAILGLYLFIPEVIIKLLLGSEFLEVARFLVPFGIMMVFYSLVNLLVNYYLSINNTRIAYLPIVFSLILVILMVLFHGSLAQIIYIRIIHIVLLLVSIPAWNMLSHKKTSKDYAYN